MNLRHTLVFALCLMVLMLPVTALAATIEIPPIMTATVVKAPAFVYQLPDAASPVIGGFSEKYTINIYAEESGWYRVGYGSRQGYMRAADLQIITTAQNAATQSAAAQSAAARVTAAQNAAAQSTIKGDSQQTATDLVSTATSDLDFTSALWVLDIGQQTSMYIRSEPRADGAVVGIIYGQSVGVTILETLDNGYTKLQAPDYSSSRTVTGYLPTALLKLVSPVGPYGIWIDKATQTLTVYNNGVVERTMLCTTGAVSSETPAGEFFIIHHRPYFTSLSNSKVVAEYALRFYNRIYIHATPHINGNYNSFVRKLGQKASNGCVRAPLEDAEWMYNNIPLWTKVIVTE